MTARKMPTRSSSKWIHPGVWLVALAGGATLLGACGAASSSSRPAAPPASTLTAIRTTTVYAFDINPSTDELIPAPGTPPGVISEGDESIINDQLTSTHLVGHGASAGYPIIGYDSGTCTFTRVSPDSQPSNSAFDTTLEDCAVTAFLPNGSITVQGVITTRSGAPQPATLAVTGGTGSFNGANGTLRVTFGSQYQGQQYKTLTITVQ
jgi:hypothetical protein